MHNSRALCPAVVLCRRMCEKITRVKNLRAWCVVRAATSTVVGLLISGASFAGATSPHPLNGVARVARLYDSCDVEQSDASTRNSTYEVVVRGFPSSPLLLQAPNGWACDVEDGNGSGASVEVFSPTSPTDAFGERNGIDVSISASVRDGIGSGICPYSTYKPRQLVTPCDAANSKRAAGVTVSYLVGNATSSAVVVMVTTPADVSPPAYAPGPGDAPTVTVLAAKGSEFDAWMTCRIGATVSSTCVHDAQMFASAVKTSSPFS
jgi:hypothetical protein